MATYVNDLRLKEIATGDESGTWGTSTNTNLELIAEAFSYGTEAITTNADTHTTTIADGSTDPGRSIYLKYTGTLDSACTITIGPNTVSKLWFIENATSGSQNIIISQGSGANITIPAGDTKVVYSDGAGSGAAFFDAFASLNVVDLKVQDDLTVTDDLIVNGDIDLEGSIDVNGTANLDVVDIDGALTQDGGAVFNEASADVDFRVESDGNANMLFVDGGTDRVGIGTSSPRTNLHIGSGSTGNQLGLLISRGATTNFLVCNDGTKEAYIGADAGNAYVKLGSLSNHPVAISQSNGIAMYIDTSKNVGIGTSSPNSKTHIVGAANAIALRVTNAAVDGNNADVMHIEPSNGAYVGKLLRIQSGRSDFSDSLLFLNTTTGMNGTNGSYMRVQNNSGADIFRIKGDGNVGIGESNPEAKLHVKNASAGTFTASGSNLLVENNTTVRISMVSPNTNGCTIEFGDTDDQDVGQINYDHANNYMAFTTAASERVRIDSSGNLLVGKTATDLDVAGSALFNTGQAYHTRSGDTALYLNRLSSDGTIADFRKGGTIVGSIGAFTVGTTAAFFGSLDTALLANSGNDSIHPWNASTNSNRDNAIDFGNASNRWDDIYATNGTIQTSDRNEKQDIEVLSEAEQRVAVAAKGLLRKFRWKSAVAEKGDDARTHFGIIAQDLQAAFEAEGLDAGDYAMFISSTWTNDDGVEQTRLGVRYSELLAFIIAAI